MADKDGTLAVDLKVAENAVNNNDTGKTDNWNNLVSVDKTKNVKLMLSHKQMNKTSLALITD